MNISKEDIEKRIKRLDELIAKASPSSARALRIHRDSLAKVLKKYIPPSAPDKADAADSPKATDQVEKYITPYEHEGPKIKAKKARAEVEKA